MGPEGTAARYRAFISYSHLDAAFGRRLHRRLEAYALPRRLVGRPTPAGPAPARMAPIFRDRDEMAATADLSAEVRAALAVSGALIVVGSPDAAASAWVSREVELFRELHPDRPILVALARGEPAEATPAALRIGREPLAADFRPQGDGPRLALLKLVAGVVGVGLDELIQRDAQRRLQRVTAVTAGAVAAMLAMAVMTTIAVTARAEAERQRAEAEGLVEFMLTDLRDRLKGVGRLDVLTAVNRRALAYYSDQDLGHLPPASLARRARLLHAMGEDDELAGDLPAAFREFQEASRTTAALLAAAPNDPQRIFDQAQSEYWVGFIAWRQVRAIEAEACFRRYAALATRLLGIDPRNPDWLMEAGYAENNLGIVALHDRTTAAEAERRFERALAHFRAAAAARPNSEPIQVEIANGFGWLASSQRAQGRFDAARASRGEEARIISGLAAKDPMSHAYDRSRLANALGVAFIDLDAGEPAAATAILRPAFDEASGMAASDPKATWRFKQKLAIGLTLAKALLESGAGPDAAEPFTADCQAASVTADQELTDLCMVTAARIAAARGDAGPGRAYLRANAERFGPGRLSPRWGLNFRRELEQITAHRTEQ